MDTKPLFPRDQTPEPLDTQGLRDELERMKQQSVDYKDMRKPKRKPQPNLGWKSDENGFGIEYRFNLPVPRRPRKY
jgi:hypothetical protein